MLSLLKKTYLIPLIALSCTTVPAFNCPNQIEGKTVISSNIIGTGKFAPTPTGAIYTSFNYNHTMTATVDGKTVTATYEYKKLPSNSADLYVSHPTGPFKGLNYVSHLHCSFGTFFAKADDNVSWMGGNFTFH